MRCSSTGSAQGLQTGLAIHAATGDDIARLGSRASAGCVHLSPQNAAPLYELIRADYRGPAPRFAYNSDTQTMSNRGDFMHDAAGRLKMADGYRVLVDIEDYGGENLVACAVLIRTTQAWPVTSQRIRMIGRGMPMAHKKNRTHANLPNRAGRYNCCSSAGKFPRC